MSPGLPVEPAGDGAVSTSTTVWEQVSSAAISNMSYLTLPACNGNSYEDCGDDGPVDWDSVQLTVLVILVIFLLFGVPLAIVLCREGVAASLEDRFELRKQLEEQAENGPGLTNTAWSGNYYEEGERKRTVHHWIADREGFFHGAATEDDGIANVVGVMNWPAGHILGRIAWRETWDAGGVVVEVTGKVEEMSTYMVIRAEYETSTGVSGSLTLQSRALPGADPARGILECHSALLQAV